jgi:hypothetical protein
MQVLSGANPKTLAIEVGHSYCHFDSSGKGIIAGLVGIGELSFFDEVAEAAHNASRRELIGTVKVALVPGKRYGVERVAEALAMVPNLTLEVFDLGEAVAPRAS